MNDYKAVIVIILSCIFISSCGNLFHDLPDISQQDNPVSDPVIPEIVYTYPPDKAVDIELDKSILASFNKEMDAATINSDTFIVKRIEATSIKNETTTVETIIHGDISIHNNNTVIFRLKNSKKMDPFSNYSVFVSKDIKDNENLNLKNDYTWGFKTGDKEDNSPPEVIEVEPINFIYTIDNIVAKAVFDEDINPFTISSSNFILKKINSNNAEIIIPGTVSYDFSSRTALYIPDNPLEVSTSYTVALLSGEQGLKDLADNSMISDYNWDFRHLITYRVPCDIPGLDLDCCDEDKKQ